MQNKPNKRFTLRSVAAMMLTICVIGLTITAFGMEGDEGEHIAGISYESGHIWKEIHGLFGIGLIASSLCHMYLNRRLLMNHFKRALGR